MNHRYAVTLHLHYRELWPDFALYLTNIRKPFDLYVNLTEDAEAAATAATIQAAYPGACVLISPNSGLDVGGQLRMFNHIFDAGIDYEACLVLHGKKHTAEWRGDLMLAVMCDVPRVDGILDWFANEPRLGMVGCARWLLDDGLHGGYAARQRFYLEKFGLTMNSGRFIAGTMFWIRWRLLKATLGTFRVRPEEFEKEDPWAIERLFGSLTTASGFEIRGV